MTVAAREASFLAAGRAIVDQVTLTAASGTTLGLLGPNGSGKSSLLRLVCGLRRVASGVITLDDADIAGMGRRAVARRVAFVEQQASTDAPLTVLDVMRLGRTPHRGPIAAWTPQDEAAVEAALVQVDLAGRRHQRWHTLSGGERQRAHIGRALAQCPSELLLDEPTNHLDIRHQMEILGLVARLPITAIVALHDLNHAAMFCDSLLLLQEGRVVASGTPEQVLTVPAIAAVFGVCAHVERSPHHGRLHVQFLGQGYNSSSR